MRIMISYRFSGEKKATIEKLLKPVWSVLDNNGFDHFCNFSFDKHYKKNKYTPQQIMEHCFGELDRSDCILVLLAHNEKSEGMLMEVGYALAKKKRIIVAKKINVTETYLHGVVKEFFEWDDLDDLKTKLTSYKFSQDA